MPIEDYDFPCSFTFRRYFSFLDSEYLEFLSPPKDEQLETLQARVEELEQDMAGTKVVYRAVKTIPIKEKPQDATSRKGVII